jgi:triosephosphate isomerase
MQTRTRYIVGNWKMNGDYALSMRMIGALRAMGPLAGITPVICPPFTLLHSFAELLGMGHAALGAQNCSESAAGARTGEVSAAMLREQGCKYVILGHSERRQHNGETDAQISAKVQMACAAGLFPIICVGETQAERAAGQAETVVDRQLTSALTHAKGDDIIIAYEPVWAIGSGQTPTPTDISRMHGFIAARAQALGHANAQVLYGGSVKPDNAAGILSAPGVDGVLLGGAAIDPDQFIAIAKLAGSLA